MSTFFDTLFLLFIFFLNLFGFLCEADVTYNVSIMPFKYRLHICLVVTQNTENRNLKFCFLWKIYENLGVACTYSSKLCTWKQYLESWKGIQIFGATSVHVIHLVSYFGITRGVSEIFDFYHDCYIYNT